MGAWDDEVDRLSGLLEAERARLESVLERARSLLGKEPRLDAKRLAPAQDLARRLREAKNERAARARAVPKALRQQVRQHKACLRNCEATVAALDRRGLDSSQQRARLAQHRARVAAAERAVDDAMGLPSLR